MRIALLMGLAPRKLGSFEAWVRGFCEAALRRGHRLDVFGRAPIHPDFARALKELGCGWGLLGELEQDMVGAARMLGSRYDVLHVNLLAPRGKPALIAYAAWPARVLFMFRSDLPAPGPESLHRRVLRPVLDRFTLCRVTQMAGVSDFVREKQRARFSFDPARTRTIYNGVDLTRFQPRALTGERPPGIRILTVANLMPHKGAHLAIGALARLRQPQVRLTLVGDGPELPRLQALARKLGVSSQVEFLGIRNDVHELMNQADFFVHPSQAEGFGLTVAEAMASGRAVVAFRTGGIPELIEHEHCGLLVPPGDEEQLAVAMHQLIHNPLLRQRFERNAVQRVRERFDVRATIHKHIDWCEEAFSLHPGQPRRLDDSRAALLTERMPP